MPAIEGRETYHVRLQDFASATVWKPFLIALCLMFFFQFSGINVILQYTVDIFQSADSSVEEFQVSTGTSERPANYVRGNDLISNIFNKNER